MAQIYAFHRERPANVDQHVVQTHESCSAEVSLQNAVFNMYIYNGKNDEKVLYARLKKVLKRQILIDREAVFLKCVSITQ